MWIHTWSLLLVLPSRIILCPCKFEGRIKVKLDPDRGLTLRWFYHPTKSNNCFTMNKPSPVPWLPVFFLIPLNLAKAIKKFFQLFSGYTNAGSLTSNRNSQPLRWSGKYLPVNLLLPWLWTYLALPRRLARIWNKRTWSPFQWRGHRYLSFRSKPKSNFSPALAANKVLICSNICIRLKSLRTMVVFTAFNFGLIQISLIIQSIFSHEILMAFTYSICLGVKRRVHQQLIQAYNGIHGCPYFMAHIGHKHRFVIGILFCQFSFFSAFSGFLIS